MLTLLEIAQTLYRSGINGLRRFAPYRTKMVIYWHAADFYRLRGLQTKWMFLVNNKFVIVIKTILIYGIFYHRIINANLSYGNVVRNKPRTAKQTFIWRLTC